MTDTLPIGVHPRDPSMPADLAAQLHDHPVPHDTAAQLASRAAGPWQLGNPEALAVFQRLAKNVAIGVTSVNANQGGTAKIVGRRPGRTRLSLWVPSSYFPGGVLTTTPAGVLISEDEGELQQQAAFGGAPLFVGDSADISSEAAVWAGLQPGQTLGVVAWIHCWDAAGSSGTD
jgi:hypothetical protein